MHTSVKIYVLVIRITLKVSGSEFLPLTFQQRMNLRILPGTRWEATHTSVLSER